MWNKCSSYLGYYHLLHYFRRWVLKKREKERKIRGNKKGQVPATSKEKKKVRREVKIPTWEKRKRKYRASHSPQKVSKSKKGMHPLKRAQVELDFHHCYHHHHHTPFIRHTCTSWFDLLTCFSESMVWLCNKCLVSMYTLSPTYELQISKALLE